MEQRPTLHRLKVFLREAVGMLRIVRWLIVTSKDVRQRKLDFLVIGVQKAGTTALDSYFRKHPNFRLPVGKKELHFFDDDRMMCRPRWYRELVYHQNFCTFSNRFLLGEVTPRYLLHEEYLQRIYDYHPGIKLVVSLRDPVSRAYSHWNMERQRGIETRDFGSAILEDFEGKEVPQERAYLQRGLYAKQIRAVLKYFPMTQLYVIRQETLQSDPKVVLDDLARFLGAPPFPSLAPKKVHERSYPEPISEELVKQLRGYFREDVRDLEELLDCDLTEWK